MGDKTKGLFNKFHVMRMDGRDLPGEKHAWCKYFVLDLTHDPHAVPAIRAYAESCRADYPALAADLDRLFPNTALTGAAEPRTVERRCSVEG